MSGYKMRFSMTLVVVSLLLPSSIVSAETWHLERGQDWKAVSAQGQDKYLLAVAEIKQMVYTGQTEAVRGALDRLKKDFPEITGSDLDAFIKAEILFCEGKFTKAVRAYDKFLAEYPKSELYEAALDRQFAIATAFLAGLKKPALRIFKMRGYAEGAKIMEKISDRLGDAPMGVRAVVVVAQSYEKRGKFVEAYHKWSQVASKWPTGQVGKEALLGMARCKHAAYKGPKYDASYLISAKSYYRDFKLRYPGEAKEFNIGERLEQIEQQLAYKQFSIGNYYKKTGGEQSANIYYQMVIDNWPDSTAAKMAKTAMEHKESDTEKEEK